jgi:glutathione reductase (NADPH)
MAMASYDFDLFTIGAGSGGVRASRMAAGYGARVAIAEDRYLGGTCVNVGCIPKKLLVYASHFNADFADAAGFGWSVGTREFNWKRLIENKDREIQRLNLIYERLLNECGVRLVPGRAQLLDAHTVLVGQERYTANYILVATGSWPTIPPIPGSEHAISSNEAFFLPSLPESVLVVGGGYIGVEFAGIFHGLGVDVTQVHRDQLFLRGFDDDVRSFLAREMTKKGIRLRFQTQVTKIERGNGKNRVTLTDGTSMETETIMFATGRAPNTPNLGLEKAGVQLDTIGAVVVDEYSCTTASNIYAVGDCTDRMKLTPVALAEGRAVAETLFNNRPTKPN